MSPAEPTDIAREYAANPEAFINRYVQLARDRGYATRNERDGTIIITRPHPERMQDPNESGGNPELALWHYRNLHHGPKDKGIQDPNRGPPPGGEEGSAEAPTRPVIRLGDAIVINPDPTEAAGATGRTPPRAVDSRSEIEQGHTPGGRPPGAD